jgi:DNA repair exonuclease SbcCD ATPase subunit
MTTTETNTTALILSGSGYNIEIAPEALAKRAELIEASATIAQVTNNDESAVAARHLRSLASLRIEVEKCRKAIKEPVLAVGKRIDQAAKAYLDDVESEEDRLKKLIGDHAAEVARLKAEKEAEERRIAEEARRAREAAEAAAEAAASTGKITDLIAAKQAEKERQEALAARMEAANETAATKVAEGVRFAWDFEVTDIDRLYRKAPQLVRLDPRRSDILDTIRQSAEGVADDQFLSDQFALIGIRIFKKPVVSTR